MEAIAGHQLSKLLKLQGPMTHLKIPGCRDGECKYVKEMPSWLESSYEKFLMDGINRSYIFLFIDNKVDRHFNYAFILDDGNRF